MAHPLTWKRRAGQWLARRSPRTWLQLEIARRSPHFEPEYWLLPQLCHRSQLSIDVGGNEGHFAYAMSRASSAVHVFEPNPLCLARLARLHRRNMVVHNVALSQQAGQVHLRFDPHNTGVGTIEERNHLDNNHGIHQLTHHTVHTATLDSFSLTNVRFLKIDVEGHEPAVLRGARQLLHRELPILLIECERRHNPTAFEELLDVLAPLSYSAWRWTGHHLLPVTLPQLNSLQADPTSPHYCNNFLFFPTKWHQLRDSLHP